MSATCIGQLFIEMTSAIVLFDISFGGVISCYYYLVFIMAACMCVFPHKVEPSLFHKNLHYVRSLAKSTHLVIDDEITLLSLNFIGLSDWKQS